MAAFYGTVQGERGQATRIGRGHIEAVAASWDGAIKTTLTTRDGVTWLTLERIPWMGGGYREAGTLFDGPLSTFKARP